MYVRKKTLDRFRHETPWWILVFYSVNYSSSEYTSNVLRWAHLERSPLQFQIRVELLYVISFLSESEGGRERDRGREALYLSPLIMVAWSVNTCRVHYLTISSSNSAVLGDSPSLAALESNDQQWSSPCSSNRQCVALTLLSWHSVVNEMSEIQWASYGMRREHNNTRTRLGLYRHKKLNHYMYD